MTNLGAFFIASLILTSCGNSSIPDDWKNKKLYNSVDGRVWIIINNDNTFTLHEYIPNSDQTFEWNGRIDNMKLITTKELSYQGRNDYKPTVIDDKIEFFDKSNKIYNYEFLRINFNVFNTISGSNFTEERIYTPENRSPY